MCLRYFEEYWLQKFNDSNIYKASILLYIILYLITINKKPSQKWHHQLFSIFRSSLWKPVHRIAGWSKKMRWLLSSTTTLQPTNSTLRTSSCHHEKIFTWSSNKAAAELWSLLRFQLESASLSHSGTKYFKECARTIPPLAMD